MKTHRILLCALTLGLSVSPLLALEPVATWLTEKAEVSKSGFLLPDSVGDLDFLLTDSGGVQLGEKSPSTGDAKSLIFDGTQNRPAQTAKPIASFSKVEIALQLQIQDGSEENFQTVLRCPQWELRFVNRTSTLNFIIWNEGNYTEIKTPFTKGEWHRVVATAQDGFMELTVDDTTVKAAKPVSLDTEIKSGSLNLFAVRKDPNQPDGGGRTVIGSFADLRISGE